MSSHVIGLTGTVASTLFGAALGGPAPALVCAASWAFGWWVIGYVARGKQQ